MWKYARIIWISTRSVDRDFTLSCQYLLLIDGEKWRVKSSWLVLQCHVQLIVLVLLWLSKGIGYICLAITFPFIYTPNSCFLWHWVCFQYWYNTDQCLAFAESLDWRVKCSMFPPLLWGPPTVTRAIVSTPPAHSSIIIHRAPQLPSCTTQHPPTLTRQLLRWVEAWCLAAVDCDAVLSVLFWCSDYIFLLTFYLFCFLVHCAPLLCIEQK